MVRCAFAGVTRVLHRSWAGYFHHQVILNIKESAMPMFVHIYHGGKMPETAEEGANPVSGYSVVRANDLDAAIAMAKGCSVLAGGGSVEVAERIEMG